MFFLESAAADRHFFGKISAENPENIEKPGCDGGELTISFASAAETHAKFAVLQRSNSKIIPWGT